MRFKSVDVQCIFCRKDVMQINQGMLHPEWLIDRGGRKRYFHRECLTAANWLDKVSEEVLENKI